MTSQPSMYVDEFNLQSTICWNCATLVLFQKKQHNFFQNLLLTATILINSPLYNKSVLHLKTCKTIVMQVCERHPRMPWTADEERTLLRAVNRYYTKWTAVLHQYQHILSTSFHQPVLQLTLKKNMAECWKRSARPNKLPDLIEKQQKVVDAQFVEADWALLGYSDFVVRQHNARPTTGAG